MMIQIDNQTKFISASEQTKGKLKYATQLVQQEMQQISHNIYKTVSQLVKINNREKDYLFGNSFSELDNVRYEYKKKLAQAIETHANLVLFKYLIIINKDKDNTLKAFKEAKLIEIDTTVMLHGISYISNNNETSNKDISLEKMKLTESVLSIFDVITKDAQPWYTIGFSFPPILTQTNIAENNIFCYQVKNRDRYYTYQYQPEYISTESGFITTINSKNKEAEVPIFSLDAVYTTITAHRRSVTKDEYYIIYGGNAELRNRNTELKIFSNLGIANSDIMQLNSDSINKPNYEDLISPGEKSDRERFISSNENYKVIFKNNEISVLDMLIKIGEYRQEILQFQFTNKKKD